MPRRIEPRILGMHWTIARLQHREAHPAAHSPHGTLRTHAAREASIRCGRNRRSHGHPAGRRLLERSASAGDDDPARSLDQSRQDGGESYDALQALGHHLCGGAHRWIGHRHDQGAMALRRTCGERARGEGLVQGAGCHRVSHSEQHRLSTRRILDRVLPRWQIDRYPPVPGRRRESAPLGREPSPCDRGVNVTRANALFLCNRRQLDMRSARNACGTFVAGLLRRLESIAPNATAALERTS